MSCADQLPGMRSSRRRSVIGRSFVIGALASAAIASAAPAVDLGVSSITVVQSVQYGSTPLVGGRTAMVRALSDFT